MKDELAKIRPVLDTMGPLITHPLDSHDDEDCNVADAFQSSDCLDEMEADNIVDNYPDVRGTQNGFVDQPAKKPSGIPLFHVNANKFPQVGARNKIHGLPTLVLFVNGIEAWRFEGVLSGDEILKSISEGLKRVYNENVIDATTKDLIKEPNQEHTNHFA